MSDVWSWTYFDAAGAPLTGTELPQGSFPSQTEAEAWLGEAWQDLGLAGVDAVTLRCGEADVYGPMSLRGEA